MNEPVFVIHLALPIADHRVFVVATQLLGRTMGRRAPDVGALVLHCLSRRDAVGLAEDFLDAMHWPAGPLSLRQPLPRAAGRSKTSVSANAPRERDRRAKFSPERN